MKADLGYPPGLWAIRQNYRGGTEIDKTSVTCWPGVVRKPRWQPVGGNFRSGGQSLPALPPVEVPVQKGKMQMQVGFYKNIENGFLLLGVGKMPLQQRGLAKTLTEY